MMNPMDDHQINRARLPYTGLSSPLSVWLKAKAEDSRFNCLRVLNNLYELEMYSSPIMAKIAMKKMIITSLLLFLKLSRNIFFKVVKGPKVYIVDAPCFKRLSRELD